MCRDPRVNKKLRNRVARGHRQKQNDQSGFVCAREGDVIKVNLHSRGTDTNNIDNYVKQWKISENFQGEELRPPKQTLPIVFSVW